MREKFSTCLDLVYHEKYPTLRRVFFMVLGSGNSPLRPAQLSANWRKVVRGSATKKTFTLMVEVFCLSNDTGAEKPDWGLTASRSRPFRLYYLDSPTFFIIPCGMKLPQKSFKSLLVFYFCQNFQKFKLYAILIKTYEKT